MAPSKTALVIGAITLLVPIPLCLVAVAGSYETWARDGRVGLVLLVGPANVLVALVGVGIGVRDALRARADGASAALPILGVVASLLAALVTCLAAVLVITALSF